MTGKHACAPERGVDSTAPDDAVVANFTEDDRRHMVRALELAARGLFTTSPNPRVGCVIVRDARVVGEGWHRRAGEAHAEVAALADAREHAREVSGATLYVTLEPCNRHGRTPPCVDALIAAGIARVVVASCDPNPAQAGGAARLRARGIVVDTGLLQAEADALNVGFVSCHRRGIPWVRSKIAASVDGRTALANGESRWITSAAARADGHAWRARACAVLTGVGTVLHDDPRLDVRDVPTTRQPLRVVIDRHADTPVHARILAQGNALVITAGARNDGWPAGTETIAVPDGAGRVDLVAMLRELAHRRINELHVEAGAKLNGALLRAGLVDELVIYVAGTVIGDPARGMFEFGTPLASLDARVALAWMSVDRFGDDLRLVARIVRPSPADGT